MRTVMVMLVAIGMGPAAAFAQTPDARSAPAPTPANAAVAAQRLREGRYQIGQMERVFEGAVEHGAAAIRDRLEALVAMPADMLLTENARVRGFRLDGYGVFFDVEVPSLSGTLAWSLRTLDQNDLGLDAALATLRAYVQQSGANDVNVQQALKRVELQVAPLRAAVGAPADTAGVTSVSTGSSAPAPGGVSAATVAGTTVAAPARSAVVDPVLNNPDEAYRTEIKEALIDAMLEHSRGLGLGADEWLTVAARRSDVGSGLSIDTDARTVVLKVRGADLTAFLGGQLSRDEARNRIEVRVF